MDLDAPICLCFNVSRRKIVRFIKIDKPRRASQLSECFGAGTGCGWCRPILERLHEQHSGAIAADSAVQSAAALLASATEPIDQELDSLAPEQYQAARQAYRAQKRAQAEASGAHELNPPGDQLDSTNQN